MPNMKVSTFLAKIRLSSFMKPQTYRIRSSFRPYTLPPPDLSCIILGLQNEKHPSFHKQCLNNLLLFNQRQMNLQTGKPWILGGICKSKLLAPTPPKRSFKHLHQRNSIHLPRNSCHLLAFPIGTRAKSFSKALSHLCFYISFKSYSLIMVILSEVTAQSTVK